MILSIGGINLGINNETLYGNMEIHRNYLPFFLPDFDSKQNAPSISYKSCDYKIHLNYSEKIPNNKEEKIIFRSTIWEIFESNGLLILKVFDSEDGRVFRIAELNNSSGEIRIYINNWEYTTSGKLPWSLYYPTDELLFSNILSTGLGLRFHAFGTMINGKGFLFAGNSGAGKSTLARIFSQDLNYHGLSDDRIILRDRERDRDFRIYGTPWCGDARIISPASSPLKKIFIIKHGTQNQLIPLKKINAISRLLTVSFPPIWDKRGMEYTINMLERLTENVECLELPFKPDGDIVKFLSEIV